MGADVVWLNGQLVPAADAVVSVFDHGLTVGDGVFETLKAVDGVPFAARRHLARLRASADGLGLTVPYSDRELRDAMAGVLSTTPPGLARVRITVTGGTAPLGSDRGPGPSTVVVAIGPLDPPNGTTRVCTVPWPRNERSAVAGLKTTSYAENVRALAHAAARNCTEALFATTTNLLCEGTGTNVFVVHDKVLRTPSLACGCLAGVTRALVLEVTDAVEAEIPMADLTTADEVFLTSTGRDVQAVTEIDGRALDGPGPVTRAAADAFASLIASNVDP